MSCQGPPVSPLGDREHHHARASSAGDAGAREPRATDPQATNSRATAPRDAPGAGDRVKGRVLVTPRSLTERGHPALRRLEDAGYEIVFAAAGVQPSEDDLLALVPGCVGYLAGVEAITSRVFDRADVLRVISRNGVGIDSIDRVAAARHGVAIKIAVGANSQGVAELAIGLMFAAARSLPAGDAGMKSGQWKRIRGFELVGRTVGIVGYGQVGRRVAAMALGIGMNVAVHDPLARQAAADDHVQWLPLDELFSGADVVSLHAPAQDAPLVDASLLARARAGLVLINTARAGLVDSAALLEALESGRVGAYATDVYEEEPPQDRRIVDHPRVIAAPHVGGYTDESVDRATDAAVSGILEVLDPRDAAFAHRPERSDRPEPAGG